MIFFMDSIMLTFSHLFPCPMCRLQVIPQSTLSSLPRETHHQSLILYEILIDWIVVSQVGAKSFSPPWMPLWQNSACHVQFAIIDFVCFKLYSCRGWGCGRDAHFRVHPSLSCSDHFWADVSFSITGKEGSIECWKTWGDRSQSNWLPSAVGFRWVCGYGDGRPCMFLSPMSSKPSSHLLKIQKGVSSARSDDTKSLKGVVLDWITPRGMPLVPSLCRNIKMNRSFHHPVTGGLLCPAGLD